MVRPCFSSTFRGLISNDLREVESTLSAFLLSTSVMSHLGKRSRLRERFREIRLFESVRASVTFCHTLGPVSALVVAPSCVLQLPTFDLSQRTKSNTLSLSDIIKDHIAGWSNTSVVNLESSQVKQWW